MFYPPPIFQHDDIILKSLIDVVACELCVPAGTESAYKSAPGWKEFYHIVNVDSATQQEIDLQKVEYEKKQKAAEEARLAAEEARLAAEEARLAAEREAKRIKELKATQMKLTKEGFKTITNLEETINIKMGSLIFSCERLTDWAITNPQQVKKIDDLNTAGAMILQSFDFPARITTIKEQHVAYKVSCDSFINTYYSPSDYDGGFTGIYGDEFPVNFKKDLEELTNELIDFSNSKLEKLWADIETMNTVQKNINAFSSEYKGKNKKIVAGFILNNDIHSALDFFINWQAAQ